MEKLEKIPLIKGNVYKPSRSAIVTVLENKRITALDSPDDVRHILLDVAGLGMKFYEGQSIGVIPEGVDHNGKKIKVRLYSIASCSSGEAGKGNILALCVKREFAYQDDIIYKGVCSHYLCDRKKGDKITITGPVGRSFLLPAKPSTDLLMFATGTGIAPFRGFLQQLQQQTWQGKSFLFMGCKSFKEALYFNQENNDIKQYPFLSYYLALSRIEKNKDGDKMYIQHKLLEHLEEIWLLLMQGNFSLYICGLRNMEKGLEQVFAQKAQQEGYNWEALKMDWKKNNRWNIELY